jgi:glycosyltransferase involved in cell wall biosynthesis
MKPKVSLSIITFNQIEFVRNTFDAALAQNYESYEIVVADDKSTDGTADVILDYANRFPDVIKPVLGNVNLGVTGNSNRALKACKGELIAFQGGDDILMPGKIRAQVEWFCKNPRAVLCGHDVEKLNIVTGESKIITVPSRGIGPRNFIEQGCLFPATSVMVRKSALPVWGFREELPVVSDTMLWIETLMSNGSYGAIKGVFAQYLKHGGNITNSREICDSDVLKRFDLLDVDYPEWEASTRKGRSRCYYYAEGIHQMKAGDVPAARDSFNDAIHYNPFALKPRLRKLGLRLFK